MNDYDLAQSVVKAFDTACHKAYANGIEAERSRIIKLLENRPNFCSGDDGSCFEWFETGDCNCKELIALIKGENK